MNYLFLMLVMTMGLLVMAGQSTTLDYAEIQENISDSFQENIHNENPIVSITFKYADFLNFMVFKVAEMFKGNYELAKTVVYGIMVIMVIPAITSLAYFIGLIIVTIQEVRDWMKRKKHGT